MRHLPSLLLLLLLLLLAAPIVDGGLLDYFRRALGVPIESTADPASPVANEDPPVETAASAAEDASSKVCAADNADDGTCGEVGDAARSEETDLSAAAADAREGEGADGHCVDDNENCPKWSEAGECEKNPGYMLASCRRSCNVCQHEYDENDFGKPQLIPSGLADPVKEIIANSVAYMQTIRSDPEYDIVREECRNKEERCSEWAMGTGCDDNPRCMKTECGPACQSCDHILELKRKCGLDPNGKDAIEKGGLDGLFERLVWVADRSNWEPAVLSRPPKKGDSGKSCEEDVANPCNAAEGPWVVTLDNFLLPEEKDALLKWGAEIGYERSQAGDAVIEARTSAHAWCEGDCSTDPIVKGLKDRIAHVTGTPETNHEYLQLLKYQEGQYYRPHNDFISAHTTQAHGPRMLTFFIYLNEVEKGGGTRFPRLNGLTVEPKMGKVLIWPSVLDQDLYAEDERTEHEALPVEAGQKFGANAWIHTRDFQGPFLAGCDS